jgi:NTP pyrophosphatase (non-canonical NTP hydrolase)
MDSLPSERTHRMTVELEDLTRRLIEFRDDRDWSQFHGLKNLLVGVSLEAAELLELTQWLDDGGVEERLGDDDFRQRLGEEVADVLIYLLLICERAGIDPIEATRRKIAINDANYPIEKARGNSRKYTDL